jgi:hypothetical protein
MDKTNGRYIRALVRTFSILCVLQPRREMETHLTVQPSSRSQVYIKETRLRTGDETCPTHAVAQLIGATHYLSA